MCLSSKKTNMHTAHLIVLSVGKFAPLQSYYASTLLRNTIHVYVYLLSILIALGFMGFYMLDAVTIIRTRLKPLCSTVSKFERSFSENQSIIKQSYSVK